MSLLAVQALTPRGVAYRGSAAQLSVPTVGGEITILPMHTPLTTLLVGGVMTLATEGAVACFRISEGVLAVRRASEAVVLADFVERIKD
jgi:F0F1-type ATP synthase epsilon subunit